MFSVILVYIQQSKNGINNLRREKTSAKDKILEQMFSWHLK